MLRLGRAKRGRAGSVCAREWRGGRVAFGVVFELEVIVDVAGVGGIEDGDGAAAFFGRGVGGVEGGDELAEGVDARGGELGGVGGHGLLLAEGKFKVQS